MTVRGFLGGLLIFVGGTGALLTGGCTLGVVLDSLSTLSLQEMGLFLMVGGIPFVISMAILWAGKAILKSRPSTSADKIDEV